MKMGILSSRIRTCVIAVTFASTMMVIPAPAEAQQVAVNIPAQSAADAITKLGQQTGTQILFDHAQLSKVRSRAVVGNMTVREALSAILEGSGFEAGTSSSGAIVIRPTGAAASTLTGSGESEAPSSAEESEAASKAIIVTGSHIRGATPSSPVLVVKRADIERSGLTTIGDVVRALPQNFAGGISPGVVGAFGTANSQNVSSASSANLRGLGSDATLTLVNGHRLAFNGFVASSDMSSIPLAAVERVEVLLDGASAIYGSDAVAGVVNLILKKNFSGGETDGRVGFATRGDVTEYQVSQLLGTSWDSGAILGNYEHYEEDALFSNDRSFSRTAPQPLTLLPRQNRDSLFVSAHQRLVPAITARLDVLYANRKADIEQNQGLAYYNFNRTEFYSAVGSFDVDLPYRWTSSLDFLKSKSVDKQRFFFGSIADDPSRTSYENAVSSVEANASGPLFAIGADEAAAAVGGGFRHERFENKGASDTTLGSRDVSYLYGEIRLPIVSGEGLPAIRKLELSASGRWEHYSDFGSVTTPKLGLLYSPLSGFRLKANWSKSFKAPSLENVNGGRGVDVYPAIVLGITNPADAQLILQSGSNLDLGPERSRTWTLGSEWTPDALPGFRAELTYYDIHYRGRIIHPISNLLNALVDPAYAPFVTSDPSLSLLNEVTGQATFFRDFSGAGYDPTKVILLLSNQYQNATSQDIHGVDLTSNYERQIGIGTLGFNANLSWLKIRQKLTATSASQTLTGIIFNPPAFRARGGVYWTSGPWSLSTYLNFVDGFRTANVSGSDKTDSWTTIDARLSCDLSRHGGFAKGLQLSVSAINLFDAAPPRLPDASTFFPGLGYDSTNASPLGRFVSLSISKRW
jgi:outer membrane receptor protein involved in Fe transport